MDKDLIAQGYGWLDPWFSNGENITLFKKSLELEIADIFIKQWKNSDRFELLKKTASLYSRKTVFNVIDKIIDFNARMNWHNESKEINNSSLDKFLELLWGPLPELGFEFTKSKQGDSIVFNVTRCPVFELAKKIKTEEWMYHLICMTDGPAAEGFCCNKISFLRTKTLMEGHSCCNHTYKELK